jgi:hypothetical protein
VETDEALAAVGEEDDRERTARARRLIELSGVVGATEAVFYGQAAEWLFDDVKATWIYGYFAATIVAAHAYCQQHLAGLLLTGPDDPVLPDSLGSLDELAAVCAERGLIDIDVRSRLVELHASADPYVTANLHTDGRRLERRLSEAQLLNPDEHPLLAEARAALLCCTALLVHR